MTTHHLVHGLRIESEVPLPEPETAFDGTPDLTIRRGAPAAVPQLPDDDVALRFEVQGRVYYEGRRDTEQACIRAPGRFAFSVAGATAVATAATEGDEAMLPLLAAGMGLAFCLALRGHLCLHTSAVEVDARAVALTAPSGYGKSTLAAAAVAAGHPLVADDLLRVDVDGASAHVFSGSSEIRLRPNAATLAEHWPERQRTTADERTAVAPPHTRSAQLPLAALVLPLLERDRDDVVVESLRAADAFSPLLRCPRLLGWRDPEVVARQFEQLAALAASTPVVVARVPWSTPPEPSVGAALVDRVLDSL